MEENTKLSNDIIDIQLKLFRSIIDDVCVNSEGGCYTFDRDNINTDNNKKKILDKYDTIVKVFPLYNSKVIKNKTYKFVSQLIRSMVRTLSEHVKLKTKIASKKLEDGKYTTYTMYTIKFRNKTTNQQNNKTIKQ